MPQAGSSSLIGKLLSTPNVNRPAIQSGTSTLTYQQLRSLVATTASQLRAAGVRHGDRVLVQFPNGTGHIAAALAVIACNAIAVPLDPASGPARLQDIVRQTGPRCCLAADSAPVPDGLKRLRLQTDDIARTTPFLSETAATATIASTDLTAFIRFTSGSAGHAKGVILTQGQQHWIARRLAQTFGLDTKHRELLLVSMAASGGWQRVAATLYGGGCVVIGEQPLSVGSLLDEIIATRATGFFMPPPLVRMLLASPEEKVRAALQGCRSIEIGSAPLSAAELDSFLTRAPGSQVYVHYGLTECSRAFVLDTRAHPDRLASVGTPLPGVEIVIRDETGRELPCQQPGQIHLRGPQLAAGYWRLPGPHRLRDANGWLATGDYGSLDAAGFLTLLGRRDDLINCGGHCFYPAEAEQALGMPAHVRDYLIAGVPDPRGVLQEVAWAFVVPLDATQWTPQAFLALARSRLPAHMVPRRIVAVPHLPLTKSGKPDRRETVKLYATGTRGWPHE